MANERLTVKNFGPIREADLDLRKVTVLIGEQASGKSVLAKLVNIFADFEQSSWPKLEEKMTKDLILTYLNEHSEFGYENGLFVSTYRQNYFNRDIKNIDLLKYNDSYNQAKRDKFEYIDETRSRMLNGEEISIVKERVNHYDTSIKEIGEKIKSTTNTILYIPAERVLISLLNTALYAISRNQIKLPDFLLGFATSFEAAKLFLNNFLIPSLKVSFSSEAEGDFITIENEKKLKLSEASSGQQALIPLLVVVNDYYRNRTTFIIEEPELNLYPTTQKKLVEYLIEKCTQGDNRLIITTHSPYILTALNNCIEASNVRKLHPEAEAEVDKLVPRQYQIDYEDVMAYFVANGTATPIMNEEYRIIDANALDDVSNELGRVFDSLLDLKYQNRD